MTEEDQPHHFACDLTPAGVIGGSGDAHDDELQVINLEEAGRADTEDANATCNNCNPLPVHDSGESSNYEESQDHTGISRIGSSMVQRYRYPHKSTELLKHLNDLRLGGSLVDVILASSDGKDFPCHRAVLAASSPYFQAMFTDDLRESRTERIELTNVKAPLLSKILSAVYLCELDVTHEHVRELLATAHFLSYPHIVESCCQFLKDALRPTNCLGICQLAETFLCHNLLREAWNFALKNFKSVTECQEFMQLEASTLEKLVSSDDLHVDAEDEVLLAVLRWAEEDDAHVATLPTVLANVRLPLVSDACLSTVFDSHRILHSCGKSLSLVRDAQNLKELARKGMRRDHHLLRPRHSMRSEMLVVVGGMTCSRDWVPYVSCFNPKTDKWTPMADLPFEHSDYSAASVDGAIYVTGGFHRDEGTLSAVWRYDELHNRWSKVCPLLIPRFNHSSIDCDHHVYVLGGEDLDNRVTEVERYSPEEDKWDIVGSINPTGSGMAVTALKSKLYIIGWLTNVRLMCVVQCFDLETAECSVIPCSGLNRQLFPAVALNDAIFILGGNRIKEVAIYDPETFSSTKAEPMKFKRNTPSAAVVGGKIYVTGGELRQHLDRVECYDPDLDLWDVVSPMPHALCFHGCVMVKMYLGPPYNGL
ncbi:ectoderm-neural cortex protein 1-like [Diadema antillarum]|uniref:ectoderm-neural cortex protein 1-like n=1 Tax=Diadema antillarum TaxID=105358 RepID=UPI003A8BA108